MKKQEKGITLMALIITIIVLLILAVVTIGAVQDSKIIEHAENAETNYNQAKINETVAIGGYESFIEQYIPQAAKIEYYIMNKIIQKIDRTNGIAIVYNEDDGKFVKHAENNFEEGEATSEITKINVLNQSSGTSEEKDLAIGAIPLIVNDSIVGYFSNNKLYGNAEGQYSIFELVTDESEIARIEAEIANINK